LKFNATPLEETAPIQYDLFKQAKGAHDQENLTHVKSDQIPGIPAKMEQKSLRFAICPIPLITGDYLSS
jgi:hypothetical protein